MGIEIFVLPYFLEHSTYILCGTTTMKAIVGVTGTKSNKKKNLNLVYVLNCAQVVPQDQLLHNIMQFEEI